MPGGRPPEKVAPPARTCRNSICAMNMHRIHPEAGWVDPSLLPRGPQGRGLCRECGREVPPKRRTFCGEPCVEAWRLKSDPSFLRSRVWKRDKGRCAHCGLRCRDLEKGIALLQEVLLRRGQARVYAAIRRALAIRSRSSLWDADHIRPVAQGGGGCGLENMQTLCLWCHRDKTSSTRPIAAPARG
jgi:5-methylcytosine-specific restriction protein A